MLDFLFQYWNLVFFLGYGFMVLMLSLNCLFELCLFVIIEDSHYGVSLLVDVLEGVSGALV